jgi:hypothetical protein
MGTTRDTRSKGDVRRTIPQVLQPLLLEADIGHGLLEGGRSQQGEVGRGVVEIFAKTGH